MPVQFVFYSPQDYWKYLKTKLSNEGNEVVSATNQLKLLAPDGKLRLTDVLDNDGVIALAKSFPNNKASRFIEWFTNSDESIDGKSRSKAYALFDSSRLYFYKQFASILCRKQNMDKTPLRLQPRIG